MIIDKVEQLHLYASVLPYAKEIEECFALRSTANAPCEVREKTYETKSDTARRFEVHDHTVDLMIGISGEEIIHICSPDELTEAEPLPNGSDGRKLDGSPRGHAVQLLPGTFVAIYPGEAHMVGGQVQGKAALLSKWVVKVPLGE